MYNGIFFNILQVVSLYLYYLSVKMENKKYRSYTAWIYGISALLGIVRYNVLTITLFLIEVLLWMVDYHK